MTAVAPAPPPDLTDRAFELLRQLIYREAGIALAPNKRALLAGRLARRVRELGLSTYDAYYRLAADDAAEQIRLLDAVATNETRFFREPAQLELLGSRICAAWHEQAAAGARPRRARVWSAACSTGEEPYSVAMVLHDRLVPQGWTIEVLASDLSTRALERARNAVWPLEKTEPIPAHYLRTYMLRGVGPHAGTAKVGPAARALVRFERINLRDAAWPVAGPFDAIFCRNALIYFDAASRGDVLGRLVRLLAPGGYLFLGHAESLAATPYRLQPVMPAVYRSSRPDGDAP